MKPLRVKFDPSLLRDLHVYGGVGLVAVGVGLLWLPGFLVVIGASLAGLGLFAGRFL